MSKKKSFSKDKKTDSSKQDCPLKENKTVPCDVEGLELSFIDSSNGSHKSIAKEPRNRREKRLKGSDLPYLEDSKYLKVDLYDTVLEVLAPPLMTDSTEVKKATISGNITSPIGTCPKSIHPSIVVRNPTPHECDGFKSMQAFVNQSIAPQDVYAKSLPIDNPTGRFYLRDVLYMFEDFNDSAHIKEMTFEAEACGVRDDGQKPYKRLKGLVRVYREDKYVLEVSIPSLVSKEASAAKEVNTKGESTVTKSNWGGDKTEQSSYNKNGDMTEYAETDAGYFTSSTQTLDGSTNEITPSSELLEFAKLTRNGRQLGGLDTINNIIKTRKMIVKGFSFIDELSKAVPQIGFGWSFKLDLLAGTIGGEWGLQAGSEHDTPEYKWLENYGQINIAMSIIKMELAAYFGVQCTSPSILNWFKNPAWEIIAKIEVKISIDARLDKTFKLAGSQKAEKIPKVGKENSTKPQDYENVNWTNTVVTQGEFYAQFKVTVAGYGMDAKAGVVASMKFTFKVVKPFKVRAEGKREEAYLYAYFTHFKRKKSPPWKKTICKEKDIFKERYILG